MRVLAHIPTSLVHADRHPIGRRTWGLIKYLERGGKVPPIHIKPDGNGGYTVLDGRHRLLAHRMLEIRTIFARYGTPTRERK